MAILETVTAAEKLIRESLNKRDKKASEAMKLIQNEEKKLSEIEIRIDEAAKGGDAESFIKAKQEREATATIKEMYERQYNSFMEKPLIAREDYERITEEIKKEYDAMQKRAGSELVTLSENMKAISDSVNTAAQEANTALHGLQHDLFLDGDRLKHQKTGALLNLADEQRIRDYTVIEWGKAGVNHGAYAKYAAAEGNEK